MGGDASQRGEGTVLRVTGDPTRAATFERQIAVRTGFRVRTANSVGAALGHLDGEERVVAVVADAELGDAGGVALLEFLRAERPALPVLLRTEDGGSRFDARAARAGVTRVLPAGSYDGAWETVTTLLERAVAAGDRGSAGGGPAAVSQRGSDSRQHRDAEPPNGAVPADGRPAGGDTSTARPALEGALDGIVVTVRGDVAYANRRARDAFDVHPGVPLRVGPSLDRVERLAHEISADGGWQVGDGPRPVERLRTAIPGQGGGPTPVDLTAARIRWDGAPAAMFVLRDPGPAGDSPTDGRVAALEELLDRLRTDLGTLLGGTELLRDRVDESRHTHLDSLISTATTAVTRAETAGDIAGTVRDGSEPLSIQLRPTLEAALETVRTSDPATDLVVGDSIPSVPIAADETLEPALAFLLREVVARDDVDRVGVEASLPEPGTAVEVRVAVEGGGAAAPAAGSTPTVEPGGSETGEDDRLASVLAHIFEDWGGRVRVGDDGTGSRAYLLEVPTAPDRDRRSVGDESWLGERV